MSRGQRRDMNEGALVKDGSGQRTPKAGREGDGDDFLASLPA